MVDDFQAMEFSQISGILESNAKLESSGFLHALKLAKTLQQINDSEDDIDKLFNIFNKDFEHIKDIYIADNNF